MKTRIIKTIYILNIGVHNSRLELCKENTFQYTIINIYVYIYIQILFIYIYIYLYIWMLRLMQTDIVKKWTILNIGVRFKIRTLQGEYIPIHIYKYTYIYIYTYKYLYIYIYIYLFIPMNVEINADTHIQDMNHLKYRGAIQG